MFWLGVFVAQEVLDHLLVGGRAPVHQDVGDSLGLAGDDGALARDETVLVPCGSENIWQM